MPFFFKSAKQELSPLSLFFLKLMVPLHTIKIYKTPRIYVFDIISSKRRQRRRISITAGEESEANVTCGFTAR